MKMKNKKSNIAVSVMILLAMGVFAFLVLVAINKNWIGEGNKETLSYLADYDNDGVKDGMDKCPCHPGEEGSDGCDDRHPNGYSDEQWKECKETMKRNA